MKANYIITIIIACGSMALFPSHAQQVVIKDGYTAISAEGYIRGVKSNVSFVDVPLGSLNASETVKRQKRHTRDENTHISPLFAIAPTNIDATGAAVTGGVNMTWAEAGGWSVNANTTGVGIPQPAMKTGCPEYKGKDGKDTSGAWRLPTNRELHLMNLLKIVVEKTVGVTGFQPYTPDALHWTSTETSVTDVYAVQIIGVAANNFIGKGAKGLSVRCVKEIVP